MWFAKGDKMKEFYGIIMGSGTNISSGEFNKLLDEFDGKYVHITIEELGFKKIEFRFSCGHILKRVVGEDSPYYLSYEDNEIIEFPNLCSQCENVKEKR